MKKLIYFLVFILAFVSNKEVSAQKIALFEGPRELLTGGHLVVLAKFDKAEENIIDFAISTNTNALASDDKEWTKPANSNITFDEIHKETHIKWGDNTLIYATMLPHKITYFTEGDILELLRKTY